MAVRQKERRRQKLMQKRIPCLEACDMAAALVKRVGFVLGYVSMKSEACYYTFPGRTGYLRIATHGQKHEPRGMAIPVAAKITLARNDAANPGFIAINDFQIEHRVALGIGEFFMNSSPTPTEQQRAG